MQERYHEYIKRKFKEERERLELAADRSLSVGADIEVERETYYQKEDT
jgi:hypothetical protein